MNPTKFNLILDSSQIYEYQICPLKWYYNYRENLRLPLVSTDAMDKGTLVHNLLELYYNCRFYEPTGNKLSQANSCIEIFKKLKSTEALFPQLLPHEVRELEDFICARFMLYVMRYLTNDFVLPNGSVINQERMAPTELGFSKLLLETDAVRFIVEGRIDLIINIQNNLAWTDHKSQDRQTDLYQYKPQFKTYAWATGYEYGLINYFGLQQKYVEGNTFRRTLIHFEKWMIEEWEEKLKFIFWEIYYGLTLKDDMERTFYFYRNDSACAGAFDSNPCQFTHICEIGNWEMKQKIKEFKYQKVESWSPWKLKEQAKI